MSNAETEAVVAVAQGTWVLAAATWVLAVGSLYSVYWQVKKSLLSSSAGTLMVLRDRYNSSQMRSNRKALATRLSQHEGADPYQDELLVFFDTMGFNVRKKTLDQDTAWNEFAWEVVRYWAVLVASGEIERLRDQAHDGTLYGEFEGLYERLVDLECKRREVNVDVVTPNQEEIETFLQYERSLVV